MGSPLPVNAVVRMTGRWTEWKRFSFAGGSTRMTPEPEHHGDLGEPVAAQRELFRDRHIPEHAQSKDTVQEE